MAGAEIDVLKAQIVRNDVNTPWGFRLNGGADFNEPLKILRVTPGSPAARIGLKSGDEVTEIGDTPTHGLTHSAAQDVIRHYGLSLILTVERRAHGAIPVNPVMTPQHNAHPPIASYQPYDMSGNPQAPRPAPAGYDFQSVSSRPYDGHRVPINASSHVTAAPGNYSPHMTQPAPAPAPQPAYVPQYAPPSDDYPDGTAPQSRTFKILQGLMANDEPYAGTAGLPPLRSASNERWREEQEARRKGGPRVKVFMPQQYNSPIGMYSAGNVIDTFQTQAEVRMQDMERPHQQMMSDAQRAVLEEDATRPRY